MTNVTPLHSQETVVSALRNALQIAWAWRNRSAKATTPDGYRDIARLLEHALEQLGEPNLASIQAAATMLREAQGARGANWDDRDARDCAAVILRAAVTGELPKTWEES